MSQTSPAKSLPLLSLFSTCMRLLGQRMYQPYRLTQTFNRTAAALVPESASAYDQAMLHAEEDGLHSQHLYCQGFPCGATIAIIKAVPPTIKLTSIIVGPFI